MQELLKLEEAAHVYLEDASEENEKKMMNELLQAIIHDNEIIRVASKTRL